MGSRSGEMYLVHIYTTGCKAMKMRSRSCDMYLVHDIYTTGCKAMKMRSMSGDMYLTRDIFAMGCIPGLNDYDEHTCTCMIYGC
jgi:hypothetical protein